MLPRTRKRPLGSSPICLLASSRLLLPSLLRSALTHMVCLSAEADEVISLELVAGVASEAFADPEYTRGTSFAQQAAAAATMTSDDETSEEAFQLPDPTIMRQRVTDYLDNLSLQEMHAL